MTTILAIEAKFIAGDSLWTNRDNEPVDKPLRKYLRHDDTITFFSGHEYPILIEKASLLGLISEEDYINLQDELNDEEEFSSITFDDETGEFLHNESVGYGKINGVIHSGSGGAYAAKFMHDTSQYPWNSLDTQIAASMNIAYIEDICSGGDIDQKLWSQEGQEIDNLTHCCVEYIELVNREVNDILKLVNEANLMIERGSTMSASLVSPTRTNAAPNAPKVSRTGAQQRLMARKARKAAKELKRSPK